MGDSADRRQDAYSVPRLDILWLIWLSCLWSESTAHLFRVPSLRHTLQGDPDGRIWGDGRETRHYLLGACWREEARLSRKCFNGGKGCQVASKEAQSLHQLFSTALSEPPQTSLGKRSVPPRSNSRIRGHRSWPVCSSSGQMNRP